MKNLYQINQIYKLITQLKNKNLDKVLLKWFYKKCFSEF